MTELTRFQLQRPVQKISDEDKQHIGLLLYPTEDLSQLADELRNADAETYSALLKRLVAEGPPITNVKDLNPVIASLYKWLTFKARPIRRADLAEFIKTLDPNALGDLEAEWRRYGDELLLAIERNLLSVNYCVDLQLLVRICALVRRCFAADNAAFALRDDVTDELINAILGASIMLPTRVLRGRCPEECNRPNQMQIPSVPSSITEGRNQCECPCDETCRDPNRHCICIRPYIGDLFLIRETLARYEAGDIADIENILAGEAKVRRHRTLTHTEDTTETSTEASSETERDHGVTEKFGLQSEVKDTINGKVSFDAGVTATLKYGESITMTPHANVAGESSKSESQNIAHSYSKEIVDRSVVKLQEKTRTVQTSKILREVAEHNRHSIDNTQPGASHRAGIYYWVNKISHAQVFNYGRHMMFDIIVPEPAATYKKLYQLKLQSDKNAKAPAFPNITPQSVQRNSYGQLLMTNGITSTDELQPPDPTAVVQFAFSQNVGDTNDKTVGFSSNEYKSPDIPKGYKAKSLDFDIRCSTGHPKSTGPWDQVAVSVNVGDLCLFTQTMNEYASGVQSNQTWLNSGSRPMKGEEGSVTAAVAGFSSLALSLSGSISVTCELTTEAFEKWQTKIYNLIMTEYNRKLDAYNNSYNKDDQLFQIKGRNPFLNREIERNEFKRHIVAILMCNYFNGIGSMMERVAPCGYPEINFQDLERDAPVIQFFEQVFEWEYLTYLFYHSMWARKCKWPELIDEDSGDPLFDKFLMSGASRVQVPIRPGMEEVFSWFLKTGQIWGATGRPPLPGDDDYVAMIQELKEANQGDYNDRPGLISAQQGNAVLTLTNSSFYWDAINAVPNALAIQNDIDREILVDFKIYRIVTVEQANAADSTTWRITIDEPYPNPTAANMKHAVGAVFVGAPWEVVTPTELVYLRNPQDTLPVYPLT